MAFAPLVFLIMKIQIQCKIRRQITGQRKSQTWWLTSIIPTFSAMGLRRENSHEFETNLSKSQPTKQILFCLNKIKINFKMCKSREKERIRSEGKNKTMFTGKHALFKQGKEGQPLRQKSWQKAAGEHGARDC